MSTNAYELDNSEYVRDLRMKHHYIKDAATYLALSTGRSVEEEMAWIKQQMAEGKINFVDPKVKLLKKKDAKSDREKTTSTMSRFMQGVYNNKQVMAATMTVYENPEVETSSIAGYTQVELDNRSANKKAMFKAKEEGNPVLAGIMDNRQKRNKIKVNSLSGAQGTTSSTLYDRTAHSTLTTMCRSATSNSNAITERLLASNRHYYHVDIALNNIVHTINNVNYTLIEKAMDVYGLAIPSVEFVIDKVRASFEYYCRGGVFSHIEALLRSLSPIQRAAYIYTGDLCSLADVNEHVIKDFIFDYAVMTNETVEDGYQYISQLDEDELALLGLVTAKYLNFKKPFHDEVKQGPHVGLIGGYARQLIDNRAKYELLFKAFILNMELPASVAQFPTSIRRAVIASDTDSSIFTTQDWVMRYKGGEWRYDELTANISAVVTFIAVKATAHVLVAMSRNMGVAEHHLRTFVMKNEYAFGIFSLTTMAKHYYAIMNACEGLVYEEPDWEIKGAQMKSTQAPADIIQQSDQLLKDCVKQVLDTGKVSIHQTVNHVLDIEMGVYEGIRKAEAKYFSRRQIKPESSYSSPTNGATLSQKLWNEVFFDKYGTKAIAPYEAIKVNIGRKSKSKLATWVDEIQDEGIKQKLKAWLIKYERSNLNTIFLPVEAVMANGIPEEIIDVIDIRTMIMGVMRSFYLILETLGLYMLNKNNTRLLCETYKGVNIRFS